MTDPRGLLSLGPPDYHDRPRISRRRPQLRAPSPKRQGQRLAPQFTALQEALAEKRAELGVATGAPDPQLVAVLDLAGSVERFIKASEGINLEFLAEFQQEFAEPDEDFYYGSEDEPSDSDVPVTLYMVMSNERAVVELVRLFELWQEDPRITFAQGLNPLKQVFKLLRAVRRWGPEDRVRETGLLQQWTEDTRAVGAQAFARVEIELWFRMDDAHRATAQSDVTSAITAAGGNVVSTAVLPEIAYHGVLADIPYTAVDHVVRDGPDAIALLTTESVMFVRPSIPMSFPTLEPAELALDATNLAGLPTGPPRVALLDGVPLANHVALAGRLEIDDPDGRESRYTSGQRSHGTAMASLIVHGDLSAPGPPLRAPMYMRPVLQPHPFFGNEEIAPPDELLVDLLHRAFRRMFEGEGEHPATAPSVRIVNLSLGDPARVFANHMSPLGKLLDWVTHKYNVLVLVSAGNHREIRPVVARDALASPDDAIPQAHRSIHASARQRRLLSPAEAINVLTVGALHRDESAGSDLPDTVIDVLLAGAPAHYNPVGFGFRRSVKPEVLLPGGRTVFSRPPPGEDGALELSPAPSSVAGPGLRVAAPGHTGALDGVAFGHGTSHATALATRTVNDIFDVLEALVASGAGGTPFPEAQYHPVLAKTLVVHAAGWGDLRRTMSEMLDLSGTHRRRDLTQLLGYGPVRLDRVANAERVRPLLISAGSIGQDERHTFRVPLPDSLRATVEWRRLTLTLGWLSPINPRSQKHRLSRLRIEPGDRGTMLGVDAVEADHNAIFKGTVQHQTLEGTQAAAFVQGEELQLHVDCQADAGSFDSKIRYGVAISVEVAAASEIDLEAEMRAAILTQLASRARART